MVLLLRESEMEIENQEERFQQLVSRLKNIRDSVHSWVDRGKQKSEFEGKWLELRLDSIEDSVKWCFWGRFEKALEENPQLRMLKEEIASLKAWVSLLLSMGDRKELKDQTHGSDRVEDALHPPVVAGPDVEVGKEILQMEAKADMYRVENRIGSKGGAHGDDSRVEAEVKNDLQSQVEIEGVIDCQEKEIAPYWMEGREFECESRLALKPLGPPPWSEQGKEEEMEEIDVLPLKVDAMSGLRKKAVLQEGGQTAARVSLSETGSGHDKKVKRVAILIHGTSRYGSKFGLPIERLGSPPWPIYPFRFYLKVRRENGHIRPRGKPVQMKTGGDTRLQPPARFSSSSHIEEQRYEQVKYQPPSLPEPPLLQLPSGLLPSNLSFIGISNFALPRLTGRIYAFGDDPGDILQLRISVACSEVVLAHPCPGSIVISAQKEPNQVRAKRKSVAFHELWGWSCRVSFQENLLNKETSFTLPPPQEPPLADLGSILYVLFGYVIHTRLRGRIDAACDDPGDDQVLHTWNQITCCGLLDFSAADSSLTSSTEFLPFEIEDMEKKYKGHSKEWKEFNRQPIASWKMSVGLCLGAFVWRLQIEENYVVVLLIHVSLSLHSWNSLRLQGTRESALCTQEAETEMAGISCAPPEHVSPREVDWIAGVKWLAILEKIKNVEKNDIREDVKEAAHIFLVQNDESVRYLKLALGMWVIYTLPWLSSRLGSFLRTWPSAQQPPPSPSIPLPSIQLSCCADIAIDIKSSRPWISLHLDFILEYSLEDKACFEGGGIDRTRSQPSLKLYASDVLYRRVIGSFVSC